MEYQYNDGLEFDPQADSDHEWVDLGNSKNISPDRPPVLNHDNFFSSEADTPANDPYTDAQINVLNMNMNKLLLTEHCPSSYPSSNDGSLRAPDGPERQDPANQFLAVAPATGLGEVQHHRSASFDYQVSHGIRKFLETLPPHERSFHASWEAPQGSWLPLATKHAFDPGHGAVEMSLSLSKATSPMEASIWYCCHCLCDDCAYLDPRSNHLCPTKSKPARTPASSLNC